MHHMATIMNAYGDTMFCLVVLILGFVSFIYHPPPSLAASLIVLIAEVLRLPTSCLFYMLSTYSHIACRTTTFDFSSSL